MKIIQKARGFTPNLYFSLPFEVVVEYEVRRGSKLVCMLSKIYDATGRLLREVRKEMTCDVKVRDGRFYMPPSIVQSLNLTGTEYYEVLVQKLVKPGGEEVEVYPNKEIEKGQPPKPA